MSPLKEVTNGVQDLISTWPKLWRTIVALFVAFPFVTTIYVVAVRDGMIGGDVYRQEHQVLRSMAADQLDLGRDLKHAIIRNRGLISDSTYYQQRTCINTATTTDEKERCVRGGRIEQ